MCPKKLVIFLGHKTSKGKEEMLVSADPNHDHDPVSSPSDNLSDPMEELVVKPVLAKVDEAVEELRGLLGHADELLVRLGPEELSLLALDQLWMSIPGMMSRHSHRSDLVRLAVSLRSG